MTEELMKEMLYWKNKAGELALRVLELENNQSQENKSQDRRMVSISRSESPPLIKSPEDVTNPSDTNNSTKHIFQTIPKDSIPYLPSDTKQSTKSEILKDYAKGCGEIIYGAWNDGDRTYDEVCDGNYLCEKCVKSVQGDKGDKNEKVYIL